MENMPYVPATLFCATKTAELSTSLTVSAPEVVSTAFVCASDTAAELTTAASLVLVIVTWTVLVVPSDVLMVKRTDTDWPTFRLSYAHVALYVHVPSAALENV